MLAAKNGAYIQAEVLACQPIYLAIDSYKGLNFQTWTKSYL